MRQILFRGKCSKTGEWVDGYLCYAEQQDRYYIGVTELLTPVNPETVGQYTGLLDRDGNKIFEGDIIRGAEINGTRKDYSVIYHSDGFWLDGEFYSRLSMHNEIRIKILGNIHDNPQLIQ